MIVSVDEPDADRQKDVRYKAAQYCEEPITCINVHHCDGSSYQKGEAAFPAIS